MMNDVTKNYYTEMSRLSLHSKLNGDIFFSDDFQYSGLCDFCKLFFVQYAYSGLDALSMLAIKSHSLKHTVWPTARGEWNDLEETSKGLIRDLDWAIDRPPFTKEGTLDLTNSEEDNIS
jgi:hypothetical protein